MRLLATIYCYHLLQLCPDTMLCCCLLVLLFRVLPFTATIDCRYLWLLITALVHCSLMLLSHATVECSLFMYCYYLLQLSTASVYWSNFTAAIHLLSTATSYGTKLYYYCLHVCWATVYGSCVGFICNAAIHYDYVLHVCYSHDLLQPFAAAIYCTYLFQLYTPTIYCSYLLLLFVASIVAAMCC